MALSIWGVDADRGVAPELHGTIVIVRNMPLLSETKEIAIPYRKGQGFDQSEVTELEYKPALRTILKISCRACHDHEV
jgi:hypothetical protein